MGYRKDDYSKDRLDPALERSIGKRTPAESNSYFFSFLNPFAQLDSHRKPRKSLAICKEKFLLWAKQVHMHHALWWMHKRQDRLTSSSPPERAYPPCHPSWPSHHSRQYIAQPAQITLCDIHVLSSSLSSDPPSPQPSSARANHISMFVIFSMIVTMALMNERWPVA